MKISRILVFALIAVIAVAIALSCGASDQDPVYNQTQDGSTSAGEADALYMDSDDGYLVDPAEEEWGETLMEPTPAMAPVPPEPDVDMAMDDALEFSKDEDDGGTSQVTASQGRIIVHTGRMSVVVDDVADAVTRISNLSTELGGWVVGSNRVSRHSGYVSIRVPAESLDDALNRIEALALEVDSRELNSQDVTDEYVDLESRLGSLRATRDRLLAFIERAETVEEALQVEREISALNERIEGMQGR